jgi:large subunit ribosomal protein L10
MFYSLGGSDLFLQDSLGRTVGAFILASSSPTSFQNPKPKGGEIEMGRTLENKKEIVADLKAGLSEAQLALVLNYQGLTVAEISDLRRRMRSTGTVCTVTKNTLLKIAVQEDDNWGALADLASGTNAFLFVKEDIGGAIKAYQEFQKATKKTELRGGVMEGQALNEAQIKAIGDLPSKEQLMAQIAGAINGVATKLAVGINQVPTSLARGIKAVSEKEAA